MNRTTVVTGVLIASLSANVYLLVTRSSGTSGSATSPPVATRSERRGELPVLSRAVPARAASGEPAEGEVNNPGTREREAALTRELLKAQAELEEHRPLPDRFQRGGERSPETEEQARAALDRVFGAKPGQKPVYTVECRGVVCSLKVDDELDRNDWMRTLQSSDERKLFRGMSFGVAGTYFEVASAEYLAASRYADSVFKVIKSSPVIAACKQRFPTPGEVVLAVELGPARDVRVTMTGKLADKDFGACLRPVLEQAPSQVAAVPANITSIPHNVTIISVPSPGAPQSPAAPVERRPTGEHVAREYREAQAQARVTD